MDGAMQQLKAEATRRFGGMGASNVGTQANPSASQPLQGGNPMQARLSNGAPATPTADNPMAGAIQSMNGSMPLKGGSTIEKALIKRMNMYPPQ